jgi:uncharacterized protein (DUF433 family)
MKHFITTTPNIMGGAPVVKDTRIPIIVLLHRLKEGYSLKEIAQMYPWVDKKILSGAIDEALDTINQNFHAEKFL